MHIVPFGTQALPHGKSQAPQTTQHIPSGRVSMGAVFARAVCTTCSAAATPAIAAASACACCCAEPPQPAPHARLARRAPARSLGRILRVMHTGYS